MIFIRKLKSKLTNRSLIKWSALIVILALFIFLSAISSNTFELNAATQDILDSRLQAGKPIDIGVGSNSDIDSLGSTVQADAAAGGTASNNAAAPGHDGTLQNSTADVDSQGNPTTNTASPNSAPQDANGESAYGQSVNRQNANGYNTNGQDSSLNNSAVGGTSAQNSSAPGGMIRENALSAGTSTSGAASQGKSAQGTSAHDAASQGETAQIGSGSSNQPITAQQPSEIPVLTVQKITTQPQSTASSQSSDSAPENASTGGLDASRSSNDIAGGGSSNGDISNDNSSSNNASGNNASGSDASGNGSNTDQPVRTPDKTAYLTFDDGPSRKITPKILDILEAENIKATFFVLPKSGVDDLYQRIIDEGHEVGNHSYSHNYSKLYRSGDISDFLDDVLAAHDFMRENFSYEMVSFRFPGGSMGRSASNIDPRRDLIIQLGYRWFDWSIDSGDANGNVKDKSANALLNIVLSNTRQRDKLIVLMHDAGDKQTTLDALPRIIAGLREQGYGFDLLMNY